MKNKRDLNRTLRTNKVKMLLMNIEYISSDYFLVILKLSTENI